MTKLTFFPIGNADTCLIKLQDGKRMLVDFADAADKSCKHDRCDLAKLLRRDLRKGRKDKYHIVAFSHIDKDHCKGASDFFWFKYAKKYQGGKRKKINTLWVPASAVIETGYHITKDAKVIRQEARYRLKKGKGVVVFSKPEGLKRWLKENDISIKDRKNCIVNAGSLVQGLNLETDGVEVFAHSPNLVRNNESRGVDRNADSLVFQMRFREGDNYTNVIFTADVAHEQLDEIVAITKKKNKSRLRWDVYKVPHHCSYKAVGEEKGPNKTRPTKHVKWLCEKAGEKDGYMISSSDPIPEDSRKDSNARPPHRQAAAYYRGVVKKDHFLTTMEHTKKKNPKPIVIEITGDGPRKRHPGLGRIAI